MNTNMTGLHSCALDESSLSIGGVKTAALDVVTEQAESKESSERRPGLTSIRYDMRYPDGKYFETHK